MELKLERPLVFFDLETTGTNVSYDRIVEIAAIKIMPDGTEIEYIQRVNPCIPIPASATAVHHITDQDVAGMPTFEKLADNLMAFFDNCDIAGFNSNKFDIPLLVEEFSRTNKRFDVSSRQLIDVQTIYHKMEQRTLVAAYKYYCGKNLEDAHSAFADTRATFEVLKAQLDHYPTLKNDTEYLAQFSSQNNNLDLAGRIIQDDKHQAIFNFGKYKGLKVKDVFAKDLGYYDWMMRGNFSQNTKDVITGLRIKFKSQKK